MAPKETPEVVPEKKIDDKVDNQDAEHEIIQDKLNSWLEAIDTDIVKNYLSTKLVGKEFSQTTPEEKKWLSDISEAIFKRIKKTQRVPLDITINSWIAWVMSIVGIFSPKAELPDVSSEKISQVTSTVGAFDKIRDQFEGKITKAMSQFQSLSTWWAVMSELENAFTTLEQKVMTLKDNKDTLKDKAKASNMSIKAYYKSQTRMFINEFITQLKWNQPEVKNNTQTDNKETEVAPAVVPWVETDNNEETKPEVTKFLDEVYKLEWTKYKRGGDDEDWIDCSWLIIEWWKRTWIVEEKFDTTAAWMYQSYIQKIPETKDIKKWDLLFYQNKSSTNLYKKWEISHVMIALWSVKDGKVRIFDASVSKWVRERVIDISGWSKYKLLAWRPYNAYDAIASNKKLEKESITNGNFWIDNETMVKQDKPWKVVDMNSKSTGEVAA